MEQLIVGEDVDKTCTKCNQTKDIQDFYKHCKSKDGIRTYCKACSNSYNKENYSWLNEKNELWKKNNYEKVRSYELKRDKDHKNQRQNARTKELYRTDINFKLASLLRRRMCKIIAGKHKSGSAIRDLGCSVTELKLYLESKFQPGMTWENYGINGWHIDHIYPLSKLDLSDPEQYKKGAHYTNLQPLWALDNFRKHDKIAECFGNV